MRRRMLPFCLIALSAVQAAAGQGPATEESLKMAHQTLVTAISSGNAALLVPLLDRSGIGFFRDSQAIVEFGGGYSPQDAIPAVLSDLSQFSITQYGAKYRVIGTTGLVCMGTQVTPKKGQKPAYLRSTWVYANQDGAWRLVSWHTSNVPLKK